jgi:hypothetical protein
MSALVNLLALVFATFFVWTSVLFWLPWQPPAFTKPVVVLGLAWVLSALPLRPLEIIAAAGAVGLMHCAVER